MGIVIEMAAYLHRRHLMALIWDISQIGMMG